MTVTSLTHSQTHTHNLLQVNRIHEVILTKLSLCLAKHHTMKTYFLL